MPFSIYSDLNHKLIIFELLKKTESTNQLKKCGGPCGGSGQSAQGNIVPPAVSLALTFMQEEMYLPT